MEVLANRGDGERMTSLLPVPATSGERLEGWGRGDGFQPLPKGRHDDGPAKAPAARADWGSRCWKWRSCCPSRRTGCLIEVLQHCGVAERMTSLIPVPASSVARLQCSGRGDVVHPLPKGRHDDGPAKDTAAPAEDQPP